MEGALEAHGVTPKYVEATGEAVHVGYHSHRIDASKLVEELQVVVATVLDHEPGRAVEGAVFHTDRPVVGRWRVKREWAERYETGELSETALTSKTLHTLDVASFK